MSLSDSIFIFVLALIIFGPKKLPGMAKQLGKLLGEFRRASNEFKFQIEDELRQTEMQDRQKTNQTATTPEPTILPPSLQHTAEGASVIENGESETLVISPTQPPSAPVIVAAAGAEPRTPHSVVAQSTELSEVEPTHG